LLQTLDGSQELFLARGVVRRFVRLEDGLSLGEELLAPVREGGRRKIELGGEFGDRLLLDEVALEELTFLGCVPLDPLERTGTRPTSTEIPMIPKECPLLGALFYDSDGSSGTHSLFAEVKYV
jgi:hypothetical protein